MSKQKWYYTTDGEANFHGIATDDNWLMRIQFNGELLEPEQIAHMKLIESAPELLEALQGLLPNVGNYEDLHVSVQKKYIKAENVIDKILNN